MQCPLPNQDYLWEFLSLWNATRRLHQQSWERKRKELHVSALCQFKQEEELKAAKIIAIGQTSEVWQLQVRASWAGQNLHRLPGVKSSIAVSVYFFWQNTSSYHRHLRRQCCRHSDFSTWRWSHHHRHFELPIQKIDEGFQNPAPTHHCCQLNRHIKEWQLSFRWQREVRIC